MPSQDSHYSAQAALPSDAPLPLLVWELTMLVQLIVRSPSSTQVSNAPQPFESCRRVPPAFGTGGGGFLPRLGVPSLPSIALFWPPLADVFLVSADYLTPALYANN